MKKSQSSDYMTRLEKTLAIGEEGNITARKNVDIDGTTKLNGGFKPIHTYNFSDDNGDNYTLNVLFEISDSTPIGFIGELSLTGETPDLCLGKYSLSNGEINSLSVIYCSDNSANPKFEFYNRENNNDYLFYDYIEYANKIDTQAKLYTHILTLTAGTTNYVLMYDCSINTPANSIQALRSIMKVTSTSDNVILPVVNPTDLSTAGLQVTTSLCKIGTSDVTAVSDKITNP